MKKGACSIIDNAHIDQTRDQDDIVHIEDDAYYQQQHQHKTLFINPCLLSSRISNASMIPCDWLGIIDNSLFLYIRIIFLPHSFFQHVSVLWCRPGLCSLF